MYIWRTLYKYFISLLSTEKIDFSNTDKEGFGYLLKGVPPSENGEVNLPESLCERSTTCANAKSSLKMGGPQISFWDIAV